MGKIKRLRTISQSMSLILINLGFLGIFVKHLTGPVFNCYACPWASISCPIGLLQNFVMNGQVPTYVLGTMGAVFVFVGSAFCGWVCPFGFFQDAIDFVKNIFKKKNKNPKRKPKLKNKSRDFSLITRLIVLVTTLVLAIRFVDTIFCKLCPIGTIEATFPYQIANGFSYNIWLAARIGILVVLIIMFFIISRFWCRYLCPIGALAGPSNKVSLLKLYHNGNNCQGCNICKDVCPLDIDVVNDLNSTRCTRCADCVDKCPKGHLAFGLDIFGLVAISPFKKKKEKTAQKKIVTPTTEGIPGVETPLEPETVTTEDQDVLDEFKYREKGTLVERPAYMGFKKGERVYLPYDEVKKIGVRPPKTPLSVLLKQYSEGRLAEDYNAPEAFVEEKIEEKIKEVPKSIPKEEIDKKHFEKFRIPKRTELHLDHLKYLKELDTQIEIKAIANNSSEVPAVLLAIVDATDQINFEYINPRDHRAEWYYKEYLPSVYINGKYYNHSFSEDELIYKIKTERYIIENVNLIIDYTRCIGCNSQSCKKACDIFKKIPILTEGYGIYPLSNIGCSLCGKCLIECDRGGVSFIFGDKLVTDSNFSIEMIKKNKELISTIYPETVMLFLEKNKKHSNRALNFTIALSYLSQGKLSYQLIDVATNQETVLKRKIGAIPCFWVSDKVQIAGMVSEASILAFIRKISKWKG
ncbi:MAG: quinol dehydrogenase membrane component [Candidatus Methanofastidiosum methylothiophilum]|uniref:Quinol dehydrogenase membrane component n=1 Tax=Candidatus Methanofastidiosum methylothiophilum TaxID=1705564 RepID=A0A150IJQ0_9EURY|nr:MAG: quinol dehydrogenase membrane component [Candidatus Methanofastidiosum methylthiophilus]KYC47255.1 MAG: quinol dehydrogenase membrane component [Candidatus Methanofastidiosum methylthiophilus]KYC50349.1 MAG: quinol dehydrogenase membrane component [Candidatus Methanofastidiosum methylthiophilus]